MLENLRTLIYSFLSETSKIGSGHPSLRLSVAKKLPSPPGGKHTHHNSCFFCHTAPLQLLKQDILGNVNILAYTISPLALRKCSSTTCPTLHLCAQDLLPLRVKDTTYLTLWSLDICVLPSHSNWLSFFSWPAFWYSNVSSNTKLLTHIVYNLLWKKNHMNKVSIYIYKFDVKVEITCKV